MFDRDAIEAGNFIRANTPRDAVIAHSNQHVQPSASLAARKSLVAYFGWVSNHGYNANERLGDRDYILSNLLKDDDEVSSWSLKRDAEKTSGEKTHTPLPPPTHTRARAPFTAHGHPPPQVGHHARCG